MSEDAIFRKCAWRLIPLMSVLYLVSFVDRVNVGFAALTMNRELGFSPSVYGLGAGLFFASYSLFQIPANLILPQAGARRALFLILASWGTLSASCALVRGPLSFYALRFALGAAEAGFVPIMLLYLTYWFPPSFRARCTASIQSAIPLAFILGGPISGLILQMDGIAALHGWQWLFVLEGMPAVVLAFVVLAILPESPAEARFLSDEEKHAAIARLAAEDTSEHRSALRALVDLRVIAIGVAFMAYVSTTYGVQLWLPQIVQAAGFSVFATGLIVPLPFLAAVPAMMLWGWSSDIRGERTWHVALPMLAAGAALLVASAAPNNAIVLCALFIAVIATLLAVPVFNSLPGLLLGGKAAAAAIGLNLSISNLGGLLGPFLVGVLMERTGDYVEAMAAAAVAAAVIVVALGRSIGPRAVSPAVAGA